MALPFTDKEARAAIAALVTGAVGVDPKVYPYNVLNYKVDKDMKPDFGEWPAAFTYGATGEDIHGWVVKRTAREAELRNVGCSDLELGFDVWGFYKFSPSLNDDGDSSDDLFGAIVDAVAEAVNNSPIITINSKPVVHSGLQFPALTVLRAGEQFLHFAGGYIGLQYQT